MGLGGSRPDLTDANNHSPRPRFGSGHKKKIRENGVYSNNKDKEDCGDPWSRFESDMDVEEDRPIIQDRDYHYRVLGLPVNASPKQAKQAFRQLTLLYHPDRKGSI